MADERWVFDALPDAVVVLADGHLEDLNERARSLLGLDRAAIGRPIAELLDLRDVTGEAVELPHGPPALGERFTERTVWLGHGGRAVAIVGRHRDGKLVLTARHAGRRERLDAVHGDVVATVSHEIRSPLTTVKGFTRTLLSKWDRFSDEQKRTMLETIDADADRVTRLLKELLDVSRIDAGRLQLRRSRVDVLALTEQVVAKSRLTEDGAAREVRVHAADPLPPVLVDGDKLEQVLTNLVENALRYAPSSAVEIDLRRDDGHLHLTVRDEGPGIADDQQRVVFQKFGRGRDVRRAGTGLGLYITRGLVEAHGGRVALHSVAGQGASFHVELPCDAVTPREI